MHLIEIYKALLWYLLIGVKSASKNPNPFPAVKLATQFSNWSTVVTWGTRDFFKNMIRAWA